jgi:RNA polymerase sigma-B factor
VRVPRALQERSLAVGRATEKLTHELGREPSDEELARELDIDPAEVREALSAGRAYSSSSIEKPSENTGLSLLDRLEESDPILFNAEERIMISEAIQALPIRQQQILRLRFEEDLTQTEIGDLLDISQMHVSRLLSRAIEDMRARLGESE